MLNSQSDNYRSPWWLPGGHVQTIVTAKFCRKPALRYLRQRWETPDDDFIDVDWTTHSFADDAPLLVLFHGLEGSSQSHYALSLMKACEAKGWQGAVPHFRGCSGEPNRLARSYHSGDSREIDWILRRIKDEVGNRPVYVAGVSLGGNALLKWLGEEGAGAASVVKAAVAISAPLDLEASAYALSSGFNLRYTKTFLDTLIPKSLQKIELNPTLADFNAVRRCKDFFEFDGLVTAPIHGFANAHDYWRKSASKPFLRHIAVPALVINAQNDPFLPKHFLPNRGEVSASVTLMYPESGGHVGFPSSTGWPVGLDWLPQRCISFFESK